MTTQRKPAHPTISDVALQLAKRSNPPQSKVGIYRKKDYTEIAVEVGSVSAAAAREEAQAQFDVLDKAYPRDNGEAK